MSRMCLAPSLSRLDGIFSIHKVLPSELSQGPCGSPLCIVFQICDFQHHPDVNNPCRVANLPERINGRVDSLHLLIIFLYRSPYKFPKLSDHERFLITQLPPSTELAKKERRLFASVVICVLQVRSTPIQNLRATLVKLVQRLYIGPIVP